MANIDTNPLLYFGEATKKNMKLAESYKSCIITILCSFIDSIFVMFGEYDFSAFLWVTTVFLRSPTRSFISMSDDCDFESYHIVDAVQNLYHTFIPWWFHHHWVGEWFFLIRRRCAFFQFYQGENNFFMTILFLLCARQICVCMQFLLL